MSATREHRGSDTFRFECSECGAVYRATASTSMTAIQMAARRGWTFPKAHHDLCPTCKPKAATRPRRA